MSFTLTPRKIVGVAVVMVILFSCFALAVTVNGGSFDFSDREVRIIVTDSMDGEPTDYPISTIEKGALVVVRHISDDEKPNLKVGDVVQFRFNGILNHHRVVNNDVERGILNTKGDNTPDGEVVNYSEVTGIVAGKSLLLGEIVGFVQQYKFMLLFAVVFAITAIELIKEMRKGRSNEA